MGLRALWKNLFRDRDPLGPVEFELELNPRNNPVQLVLLNDDKTPMDFVVKILTCYLGQERQPAMEKMLAIHTKGEAEVAVLERGQAARLICQIELESRKRGYPLICEARPL